MPALTKQKGDIGVTAILANITSMGYLVCLPFGDNALFDLVVFRENKFEKVQCKCSLFAGKTAITLRITKPKTRLSIARYAKDFLNFGAVV